LRTSHRPLLLVTSLLAASCAGLVGFPDLPYPEPQEGDSGASWPGALEAGEDTGSLGPSGPDGGPTLDVAAPVPDGGRPTESGPADEAGPEPGIESGLVD
jgi:hypothetical protein